jgi:penicillin-insensitive murein endopeptidase
MMSQQREDNDTETHGPRPKKDTRGFFMLPQSAAGSGYYTYGMLDGRPDQGAYQYPHPTMMTAIFRVAFEWQAIDNRRFGVGNISLAGGRRHPDHASHQNGLQVDIRPMRKDGREAAVTWMDNQYDQAGTAKLIDLFRTYASATRILFNGHGIPFVTPMQHHDDHFHVELRAQT